MLIKCIQSPDNRHNMRMSRVENDVFSGENKNKIKNVKEQATIKCRLSKKTKALLNLSFCQVYV